MPDSEDRIKILNVVHEIGQEAKDGMQVLDNLMNNPVTPPALKVQFMKLHSCIRMQDYLIKNLMEDHFDTHDKINEIRENLEKKIK